MVPLDETIHLENGFRFFIRVGAIKVRPQDGKSSFAKTELGIFEFFLQKNKNSL
jgi:hypothetical protein